MERNASKPEAGWRAGADELRGAHLVHDLSGAVHRGPAGSWLARWAGWTMGKHHGPLGHAVAGCAGRVPGLDWTTGLEAQQPARPVPTVQRCRPSPWVHGPMDVTRPGRGRPQTGPCDVHIGSCTSICTCRSAQATTHPSHPSPPRRSCRMLAFLSTFLDRGVEKGTRRVGARTRLPVTVAMDGNGSRWQTDPEGRTPPAQPLSAIDGRLARRGSCNCHPAEN